MISTLRHQLAILIVACFPPILSRYIQPERDTPFQVSHSTRVRGRSGESLAAKDKEETMTEIEANLVTEQPVAEPEAPAPTELQVPPQSAEPLAEQAAAEQAAESPAEQSAAPTTDDAPTS